MLIEAGSCSSGGGFRPRLPPAPEHDYAEGEVVLGPPPPARLPTRSVRALPALRGSVGAMNANAAYAELKERLAEIADLDGAASLLGWDQQVKMPPGGAAARAEQLATLGRLSHEALTSDEIGRLLDTLAPFAEEQPYDSDEASLIRIVRRDWDKARRVPAELRAEIARAGSLAMPVWVKARQESDYKQFIPALRTNLELRRRYIECFDDYDEPYDVLLDDFEPGMKTAEVRAVFERLKQEQVPLVAGARSEGERPVREPSFPVDRQQAFELKVIERFGFDPSEWRLDTAVHPFATSISINDIRLTTRYAEGNLDGLFSTMHECGHGLYEHGVDQALERTPLASGASLALHESQSRMWENLVGRSLPFWRHFYPDLRATFPESLDGDRAGGVVPRRQLGRAVADPRRGRRAGVQPPRHPPVRAGAGAARRDGVAGRAPGGVEPADGGVPRRPAPERRARRAPGHALGGRRDRLLLHLCARQRRVGTAVGEAERGPPGPAAQIEQGEFGALAEWLRERLWRHGRKFMPRELVERITGGGLDPEPYLQYLNEKYPLAH